MSNPLPIKKVHHLEMVVGNAKQASYYYRNAFGFKQALKWCQNFQLRVDQGDHDVDVILSADLEQCFRIMVFLDPGQNCRAIAISKRRRTGTVVSTEDFAGGAKCFLEVLDEVTPSAYGCQYDVHI